MWEHRSAMLELNITPNTSVYWKSWCSEVLENWVGHQEPIGGEGIVVEIDKSVMARRKYIMEGLSARFGYLEESSRVSKRKFILPLLDGGETLRRDKETLIPLIRKYIRPGSIMMSDCWAAYSSLSQLGFTHHQINHSNNFVDPGDATIHIQCVERL